MTESVRETWLPQPDAASHDYLRSFAGITVEVKRRGAAEAETLLLREILPVGLCPLFYHNLMPYMATLLDGGWFRWVKRDKNSFWRRPSSAGLFKDSRVNSSFPNEVLVQCPNHRVSVVAGVGVKSFDGERNITLRILRTSGTCLAGYAQGDEINVRQSDMVFNPFAFNALFPVILYASQGGQGSYACRDPKDGSIYTVRRGDADVRVSEVCSERGPASVNAEILHGGCRYHTAPTEGIKSGPDGFCQDAHHAIYPFGLNLLYDGVPNGPERGALSIDCPGVTGKVVFRAERDWTTPIWLRRLKGAAAKVFERLFHPVDLIDCKVTYTVVSVEGQCPAGHKAGDVYEFNVHRKTELCPASFHSAYPYIFLKERGVAFHWRGGQEIKDAPENNMSPCPDCMGAVYRY